MTLFDKEQRDIGENVLEETISNYPINAKHKPFIIRALIKEIVLS